MAVRINDNSNKLKEVHGSRYMVESKIIEGDQAMNVAMNTEQNEAQTKTAELTIAELAQKVDTLQQGMNAVLEHIAKTQEMLNLLANGAEPDLENLTSDEAYDLEYPPVLRRMNGNVYVYSK